MYLFHLASSSVSETIKDTILANSPPLTMGLPPLSNDSYNDVLQRQQYSPFHRSLSNVVEPVNIADQYWEQLFGFDSAECPAATDFQCWSSSSDDSFLTCQSERELESIFDEYLEAYSTNGNYC